MNNIDIIGTKLNVGDQCFYIKHKSTSVGYALVEVSELFDDHCTVVCLSPNPTRDNMKGVYWTVGSKHTKIAYTNLLSVKHRKI